MYPKLWFQVIAFVGIATLTALVACNKEELLTSDDLTDQALYSVQERNGLGKYGCYDLVFPVSINLPDSTLVENIESYEALREVMRTWFEANIPNGGSWGGRRHGIADVPRPSFVFPISVISETGETILVTNQTEMRTLRAACGESNFSGHGWQGHCNGGLVCFDLIFPITLIFPDGTTADAADGTALRTLVQTWRDNNPGVPGRPTISFPISVTMKADGSIVVVNSADELRQLKRDCR